MHHFSNQDPETTFPAQAPCLFLRLFFCFSLVHHRIAGHGVNTLRDNLQILQPLRKKRSRFNKATPRFRDADFSAIMFFIRLGILKLLISLWGSCCLSCWTAKIYAARLKVAAKSTHLRFKLDLCIDARQDKPKDFAALLSTFSSILPPSIECRVSHMECSFACDKRAQSSRPNLTKLFFFRNHRRPRLDSICSALGQHFCCDTLTFWIPCRTLEVHLRHFTSMDHLLHFSALLYFTLAWTLLYILLNSPLHSSQLSSTSSSTLLCSSLLSARPFSTLRNTLLNSS